MVNKAYPPWLGGVENHLHQLCQGLKDKVDLEVLVSNVRFKTEIEYLEGYRVIRVASLGYLASTPLGVSFSWWMRKLKPDIIHFHFPYPVAELAYLASGVKCKQVVTYHADVVHHPVIWKMLFPFEMRFFKRADRIIATSENLINCSRILNRFKAKTTVVPFGVNLDRFFLTDKIKVRVAAINKLYPAPILFFVGRLVPYKGLDVLIQAMNCLDTKLLIAGEGPLEKSLKLMVEAKGLKDKVNFLGKLSDEEMIAHYHACDIFVLPSVNTAEAFGIVQLEAQACGKPVVSTDLATGVTFVNRDGVTGVVVPPRSIEGLVEGINKLLKDGQLRQKLGQQAKMRVESEFSEETRNESSRFLFRIISPFAIRK